MEERDPELPVATLRPRRAIGWIAAWRGALARWLRSRLTLGLQGRHAPLVLTGVVFSGMMLAMGYVADRANHAAEAIDEMHRAQRAYAHGWSGYDLEVAEPAPVVADDPWPAATPRPVAATPLFYVRGR
jgi:hypothetical protein